MSIIKIAICDDNRSITDKISEFVKRKDKMLQDVKMYVSVFYSGEDFLSDVIENNSYHIVFMDIELGKINGIEVGLHLRDMPNGDDVTLIYMSGHTSYYEEIAHVGSFRFLNKPITQTKLEDVFNRAVNQTLKRFSGRALTFQYKVNREIYSIKVDEIAYLKCDNKSMSIYVWDMNAREISFLDCYYSNIKDALGQLPSERFVQCERSHIVNMDIVKQFAGSFFKLADKGLTQLPIGRAYKENVMSAYTKHRGNQYG